MPPQLERALVQVFVAPGEIFNRNSQYVPPSADLKVGLYVCSGGPLGPPKTDKSNRHDRDRDVRDDVANP